MPTSRPLSRLSPDRVAMKVMPRMASRKNSAGLKDSTSGRRTGSMAARNRPPMTPPKPDAPRLAPSARPASPFCVIGKPSTMVAASGPVPGTPNRMLGTEPPVWTTACMASRNTAPDSGSMPKTKGMSRTMPSLPPSPGMAPKNMPIGTARMIRPTSCGEPTTAIRAAKIRSSSMAGHRRSCHCDGGTQTSSKPSAGSSWSNQSKPMAFMMRLLTTMTRASPSPVLKRL